MIRLHRLGAVALSAISGVACSTSSGGPSLDAAMEAAMKTRPGNDAAVLREDASEGSGLDGAIEGRGRDSGNVPARPQDASASEGGRLDPDAAPAADRLVQTGLYADENRVRIADGVRPYRPRFELWSDGAAKRRWLYLPEGSQIETSDMGGWIFPVGTKVWKEFTRDGVRVETRLLEKVSEETLGWTFVAYVWNAEQTEAVAAPSGVENALGTDHDVPNQNECFKCHAGSADMLLGVSALQLSHDTRGLTSTERAALGLTLADLVDQSFLTDPPTKKVFSLPGDETARPALATLHVNCGTCHRPDAPAWERVALDLHLAVDALGAVESTGAYRTTVGVPTQRTIDGADVRLLPGEPEASALYLRMTSRDGVISMPPIATELVDEKGARAVHAWISAMPPLTDGGARDGGAGSDGGRDAGAQDGGPQDGGPQDGGPQDGGA